MTQILTVPADWVVQRDRRLVQAWLAGQTIADLAVRFTLTEGGVEDVIARAKSHVAETLAWA